MNGKVHGSAGVCIASSLLVTHPTDSIVVATAGIVGGALFGLLPDIDHPRSSLSLQPGVRVIAAFTSRIFKHRGFTHSLTAAAALYAYLSITGFKPLLIWTWVGAYLSHIVLDMFNEEGVQLLWPFPYHVSLLPNLVSVSSRPYSLVQALLFIVFQLSGSILSLHIFMTLFFHTKLSFLSEIWYHYFVPLIPFI